MPKHVLGISGFYHDSAAAIVSDGKIVAAAQEERFTRKKHDSRWPAQAINYCLEAAFIESDELDAVVFYEHPLLKWDRVVRSSLVAGAAGSGEFAKAAVSVLGTKVWLRDHLRRSLGDAEAVDRLLVTEHHLAHAASAFYPSPFQRAAILTLDGVGEWATTSLGVGEDNRVELFQEIRYPHSLGLLYSSATYFCGFKVNSGEYKLMGLAPYGEPRFYDRIRDQLIDIKPDGSFRLNMEYFGYLDSDRMTNQRFHDLFGGEPRQPESRLTRREMDLAASVQKVIEDVVIALGRTVRKATGSENVVLAGGVALNCVANGKLLREGVFDDLWVQPASGDAGGALGAALLVTHQHFGLERQPSKDRRDSQQGSYLGPSYSKAEINAFLSRHEYPHEVIDDSDSRAQRIAKTLASGQTVGFFSGRMEYGPRALGARSILGDPRNADTQSVMNLRIKFRESFRPFAPSVLKEDAPEYFDLAKASPYMLLVAPVRQERCLPMERVDWPEGDVDLIPIVNQQRSDIPAVTHVDYSARVQTVGEQEHPEYHRVLEAFKELTGTAVIVNTSFNVRGEPIVCTPKDAYLCFMRTGMDLLVLENCLIWKNQQPSLEGDSDWRKQFELD